MVDRASTTRDFVWAMAEAPQGESGVPSAAGAVQFGDGGGRPLFHGQPTESDAVSRKGVEQPTEIDAVSCKPVVDVHCKPLEDAGGPSDAVSYKQGIGEGSGCSLTAGGEADVFVLGSGRSPDVASRGGAATHLMCPFRCSCGCTGVVFRG